MRIISWNAQGMKKSQVLREVQFLKCVHKPNIMFILETMVNSKNVKTILPNTGFEHFDYVDPVNHSSGLAILWNNKTIYPSILSKEQRAIHLVHNIEKKNVIVSGVYAPAQHRENDSFWNHLL